MRYCHHHEDIVFCIHQLSSSYLESILKIKIFQSRFLVWLVLEHVFVAGLSFGVDILFKDLVMLSVWITLMKLTSKFCRIAGRF